MRVQSPKPSRNSMGGWIHSLNDDVKRQLPARPARKEVPTIDAGRIMAEFGLDTHEGDILGLGASLGLPKDSLVAVGCAWAARHSAFAFPMRDGAGRTVGIRLRALDGRKWAVTGSRSGIFWPAVPVQSTVYVTEGPTDTAAAITIGLYALGRPSCSSGVAELLAAMAKLQTKRVVIVTDNDTPGINGAMALQKELRIPSCIFIPPAKDFRAYVNAGGTKEMLDSVIKQTVWNKP